MIVGAHELEEVLQGAFEAHLVHDGAHLAMDAVDLGEADIMDFLGRQVGQGGEAGQLAFVIGLAARQFPGAVTRIRHLGMALEHVDQAAIGQADRAFQSLGRAGDEIVLRVLVDVQRLHLAAEIGQQRALAAAVVKGRTGDQGLRVADEIVESETRRQDAGLGAFVGAGDQRVENRAQSFQAADIGLGVIGILDPVLADQQGRHAGVRTEHLGEDIILVAEFILPDAGFLQIFEDTIGNPGVGIERVIVETVAHIGEAVDAALLVGGGGLVCHGIPAAIGVQIVDPAELGLGLRRADQIGLEQLVEPGIEAFAFALFGLGGPGRLNSGAGQLVLRRGAVLGLRAGRQQGKE